MLIYQQEAPLLARTLLQLLQAKNGLLTNLQAHFERHPDQAVFSSPSAGRFLAPALLRKCGDDRNRFPRAASIQALAGTCSVTDQIGKHKLIKFRHA